MELRLAKESEASDISAIAVCVWVDTYAVTGVFNKISKYVFSELSEQKIKEAINTHSVIVAAEESGLYGYMILDDSSDGKTEIETLYILPGFQGKGIGHQFMSKAKEISSKTLWLSVWDQNLKAINFYKKHGFQENGELYFDLYGEKIRNLIFQCHP